MRPPLLLTIAIACAGGGAAYAADAVTFDFGRAPDVPWLQSDGDVTVDNGVLRTAPRAGWQRSGLFVGPLPVAPAPWLIEFDVRPLAYGQQCQEFVSQAPSTHWYMVYVNKAGQLNLHTKGADGWQARASSPQRLELNTWYHVAVSLSARSIRYSVARKEDGKAIWDSGEVAMEDLGRETVFGLVDEAPDTVGKTEWDNLRVSTPDAALAEKMAARARELAAEREEEQRRQEVAARLREAGVALIPAPQQVELGTGKFTVSGRTVIIPDPNAAGAAADAETVQSVLRERMGVTPAIGTDGPGNAIVLTRRAPDATVPWKSAQGYRLAVLPSGIELVASSPEGFFYAAQTLCQLADERHGVLACRITDWPAIEQRLVMIALSQGAWQVIDVEYWKRMIRELAAVKINYLMAYDDGGTFDFAKYPFLAMKGRDGFSIEKGRLLSEYARQHFIRIVPQQQTLGHSGNILRHEQLKDVTESGGVYCSSSPRTFQFLGDLFDDPGVPGCGLHSCRRRRVRPRVRQVPTVQGACRRHRQAGPVCRAHDEGAGAAGRPQPEDDDLVARGRLHRPGRRPPGQGHRGL